MSAVAAQWMSPAPTASWQYYRRADHGLHAFMSVVTLGAWLPVWAARSGGRYRVVR